MKNTIKVAIIFEIATYFFPVYPMGHAMIKLDKLKTIDNFLSESHFSVEREIYRSWGNISADSPLCNDPGLLLVLSAISFLDKHFCTESSEHEKDLETIRNVVSKGRTSLTSHFVVKAPFESSFARDDSVFISPSREPISVFSLVGNLFKVRYSHCYYVCEDSDNACVNGKKLWTEAVVQGYDDREKNRLQMSDALRVSAEDVFKIDLPENLSFLIASYLQECSISKEDKKLIEEIKEQLKEKKPLYSRGKIVDFEEKSSK